MKIYTKVLLSIILLFVSQSITLKAQPGSVYQNIEAKSSLTILDTNHTGKTTSNVIYFAGENHNSPNLMSIIDGKMECPLGGYVSSKGAVASLTAMRDGRIRYTFFNGSQGVLHEKDAVLVCRDGVLYGDDGASWQPVDLRVTRSTFESDGETLTGELIEPVGVRNPPLVVLAHGSEDFGWLGGIVPIPYLLAADGLAVFIFDKRGTGLSGGEFHMNFRRLAHDLTAASGEAKRLAEGRYSSFGLMGFSQGGWVAPLAALEIEPDFLVVGFGLAVSPQEEDAEVVQTEMREAGYDSDALSKAQEVTDATGAVMVEGMERGWDQLKRVRQAYSGEYWFSEIQGEFTGRILAMSETELREAETNGELNRFDIEYDYDTRPVLAAISTPLLWIAAGADRVAPPEVTLGRLESLREQGHYIELAVFPETDHGMREFEELPNGSRVYGGIAKGYFALLSDWAKGCVKPSYGRAELVGVESRHDACR
jgi:uncharacterized protein